MTIDYESPHERWQRQSQTQSNRAMWWLLAMGVLLLCLAGVLAWLESSKQPAPAQTVHLPIDAALRQQAQAGDAEAQYRIGRIAHNHGDEHQAIFWYERAAKQNHAKALNNAAVLYLEGEQIARNLPRACAYFEAAAAQLRDAYSADNVRLCHEERAKSSQ